MDAPLFAPYIQYGFAGFALVQLFVIVWLVSRLISVLQRTNEVIAGNTEAIREVNGLARDHRRLMREIRDQLLTRPCLIPNPSSNHAPHEDRTPPTRRDPPLRAEPAAE